MECRDLNEKYLYLFGEYIKKVKTISSGFADQLLNSTTKEEVQESIDAKKMYIVEINAYDSLVEEAEEINNKVHFAELRDNYLDNVIKTNSFEEELEETNEKNNTK